MVDEQNNSNTTAKRSRRRRKDREKFVRDREASGESVPAYLQTGTFGRRVQDYLQADCAGDGQVAQRSRTGLKFSSFPHQNKRSKERDQLRGHSAEAKV